MWLLPTENPDDLHRFFMWCRDSGLSSPGIVLVNRETFKAKELDFKNVIAPSSWKFIATDATDFADKIREVWDMYKDAPWMGVLGDDCVPLSTNWEGTTLSALMGWNVISTHDDRRTGSGGIGRGCIWSGDLVRRIGSLFFANTSEVQTYAMWRAIAAKTNNHVHKSDVVIRRDDLEIPDSPHDVNHYAEVVETLKKDFGLVTWNVDYTGVKLMVAVPTVDGCLEYEFLGCLHETFGMLSAAGVPHEFIVEPFNADIVMARAKLFNKFMRGDATHLLMIDSDMGWTPSVVGRLFAAKKDFVAVAGPKKREPLQCAVTPLPLNKNFGRLNLDMASGTCEVAEVGAAFCLFTRAFGEKMIEAYQDLAYMGIGGEIEYSIFIPMIVDKAYKAEDYAMCHRWRKIGGQAFVCPDISLKHVGRKVYEGAWSQTWPSTPQVQQAEKEAAE